MLIGVDELPGKLKSDPSLARGCIIEVKLQLV